jgi:hypothetical protein
MKILKMFNMSTKNPCQFFSLFPVTFLTNKLALLHENLLQPSLMFANKVCVGSTLRMETLCVAVKAHKGQPECCEDFKNVQCWHQMLKLFFSSSSLTRLTNKLALLHENLLLPCLMFVIKDRVGYNLRMEAMYVAIKAHKGQPECCVDFKNVQH